MIFTAQVTFRVCVTGQFHITNFAFQTVGVIILFVDGQTGTGDWSAARRARTFI